MTGTVADIDKHDSGRGPERKWWRNTGLMAWGGAAACLAMVLAALVIDRFGNSFTILAIPAGRFVAAIVIPPAMAALVFLHAGRQEVADRKADLSEY